MASTAGGFKLHHRLDRRFVAIIVAAIWVILLSGFARDMIRKTEHGQALFEDWVVVAHALVYTGWLALLATQVWLIRTGKPRVHMSLGRIAVPLLIAMVILGPAAALTIDSAPNTPDLALQFLSVQLTNVFGMAVLLGCGLALRRHPATHKRLMLLGAIAITEPGFSRLLFRPIYFALGGGVTPGTFSHLAFYFASYGGALSLILAMGIYDLWTRGRLHPAYVAGASWIIANEVLAVWLMTQPFWLSWMKALTGH